jgi:hypothetical protein
MDESTSVLFGLESFVVTGVVRVGDGVQVMIETTSVEAACPACGVLT